MASETTATFAAMLKEWYTPKKVETTVLSNSPLLAMIPKETDLSGDSWDIPIWGSDPQAGSALFATALANKMGTTSDKFQITTLADEYGMASISRKVMKASLDKKGSFMPAVRPNIDGALNTAKRSLSAVLYRDGSGAKGKISSINDAGTNGIITLTSKFDAVLFSRKEYIQFCATKTGGTLKASGAHLQILSVDKAGGTITVSGKTTAVFSGGDALAGNDYIYRDGDYDAVGYGLEKWIPYTAPSTSFWGVNRALDPVGYGGVRHDGSSGLIVDALIDAQSLTDSLGDGAPDHVFLNPAQMRALLKEMNGKVTLQDYKVTQTISFKGFEIQGDKGTMRIFADRYCPMTYGWGLTLDTWELGSMGPVPEIFRDDLEMLREASSDGYEIRVGGYYQLACHAPAKNFIVNLPTQTV